MAGAVTPAVSISATDADRWRSLNGQEYVLAGVYAMSPQRVDLIRSTVRRAWDVVRAVAPIARALPDDILAEFGIPATALEIVRGSDPVAPETLVGRFDLIETPDGYRVIEFNAETPFFIVETHALNGTIARRHGFTDPNADCAQRLGRTIARAIGAGGSHMHVAVAAHDGYFEDRATAHYLRALIATASNARVTYAPLETLRVRDDGLWSAAGRIDVLYRLYPLEHLAADGPARRIFDLVAGGRLRLLNPPSALVAQSKMLFVLIWGLAQRDDVLAPAQCAAVRELFAPTFADLPEDGETYVAKSVLGREGASVAIVRPDGTRLESRDRRYADQPRVYQRHFPLPLWRARTPGGTVIDGRVVTTGFVAGGEPGAVGIRLGGEITDGSAHFAATGVALSRTPANTLTQGSERRILGGC